MSLNGSRAAIERAYAAVRLVSVDVALAALGGGTMAVRVLRASPRPAFYVLLPASVWVVYTLDHLIDAARMGASASTPRHRFHVRHATVLWALLVPTALACGVGGLLALSWVGVGFGVGMAVLVGLHELLVKLAGGRASPLLVKELGVGVIFAAGTWGLPGLIRWLHAGPPAWTAGVMFLQYMLLAGVNLIAFSMYEARQDAAAGQTSFVRGVGRATASRVAAIQLAVQAPLAALVFACGRPKPVDTAAEAVLLAMTAGLAAVLRYPRWFARHERYRTLGDGVFLIPLILAVVR